MNGKWLLLFMLCLNIVCVYVANTSTVFAEYSINSSTTFINNFFILGVGENTVPQINSTFAGNITTTLNANTANVAPFTTLGGFIDIIRLVLSVLALLTPIPSILTLFTLQLPGFFILLFGVPFSILYVVSVLEFLRGGQF